MHEEIIPVKLPDTIRSLPTAKLASYGKSAYAIAHNQSKIEEEGCNTSLDHDRMPGNERMPASGRASLGMLSGMQKTN